MNRYYYPLIAFCLCLVVFGCTEVEFEETTPPANPTGDGTGLSFQQWEGNASAPVRPANETVPDAGSTDNPDVSEVSSEDAQASFLDASRATEEYDEEENVPPCPAQGVGFVTSDTPLKFH